METIETETKAHQGGEQSMARGSRSNRILIKEAAQALDQMKYETASELGVNPPADGYWGDLTARECGAVGGHMVRKMIQRAEQFLVNQPRPNL